MSYQVDAALQRYFFDIHVGQLPAEAEVVTGAVLHVYKFPAYGNMAATGAGHAHQSPLVLRVFKGGDDVTAERSVIHRWYIS